MGQETIYELIFPMLLYSNNTTLHPIICFVERPYGIEPREFLTNLRNDSILYNGSNSMVVINNLCTAC